MITALTLCTALVFLFADEKTTSTASDKAPAAAPSEAKNTSEKSAEKTESKSEVKKEEKTEKEQSVQDPLAKADAKKEEKTASDDKEKSSDDDLLVIEANIVSYTNAERARYGLPPLQVDKNLMKTAREHCSWMTRMRSMVHTRLAVAENIAMGQPSSRDVVNTWMNSSGHRANILNPGNHRIGVAAYRTESGTIFWCQQFAQ